MIALLSSYHNTSASDGSHKNDREKDLFWGKTNTWNIGKIRRKHMHNRDENVEETSCSRRKIRWVSYLFLMKSWCLEETDHGDLHDLRKYKFLQRATNPSLKIVLFFHAQASSECRYIVEPKQDKWAPSAGTSAGWNSLELVFQTTFPLHFHFELTPCVS